MIEANVAVAKLVKTALTLAATDQVASRLIYRLTMRRQLVP